MVNLVTFPLGFGLVYKLRGWKDTMRAENQATMKVSFVISERARNKILTLCEERC